MAFASFGIITPVLSVVLSVFMLGLAGGSWLGGRWIPALTRKTGYSAAFFYAGAELVIGLGAFAVPKLFAIGETMLLASGETNSFGYLALSALVLAASILPWCVCMGTTFPFMMAYIRERDSTNSRSFSFLYLANVLGAMTGTLLAAVVCIELLGFHHTLWVAAVGNFIIAFISVRLGLQQQRAGNLAGTTNLPATAQSATAAGARPGGAQGWLIKWILFSTGFIAMAMEVVWTRAFTPVLKTQVYSFAMIVFAYLGRDVFGFVAVSPRFAPEPTANANGDFVAGAGGPVLSPGGDEQSQLRGGGLSGRRTFTCSAPLLLLASIVPFCALLGYLTPGLIDEFAGGNPAQAGRAYAINVLGCILGPLLCVLPVVALSLASVIP